MFEWIRRWRRLEQDTDDELDFHRAMLSREAAESGMADGDAYARRRLGNATQIKEATRAVWVWTWLETLLLDVRFGLRQLRKGPVLVAVAVLSLALGIGANTAIFSVIDALMLRSLPVRDPGRLVLFHADSDTGTDSGPGFYDGSFSYPFWQSIRGRITAFEDVCAFKQGSDRLPMHMHMASGLTTNERASVHLVSGNYFLVLGVSASVGRVLSESDDQPSAQGTAVLSYPFWRDRFNSDPAVLGQTVTLKGVAFTIIGVAAKDFFGERVNELPDFWLPLSFQGQLQESFWIRQRDMYWLNMLGRLRAGATLAQTNAQVDKQLREYFAANLGSHPGASDLRAWKALHAKLAPGGEGISGARIKYADVLHVLMGAVGAVLLIACANVALLLLARSGARTDEFLARMALGASRARVMRQVLVESVLLALLGGLAGTGFAYLGVKALASMAHLTSLVKPAPNAAALAFTSVLSLMTGIGFGVWPALRSCRIEPQAGVRSRSIEHRAGMSSSTRVLISVQVALSLVLLAGAGVLVRSLNRLASQDLGFERNNVLIVSTDPRLGEYRPEQLYGLYQTITTRMNAIPGVVSSGMARYTPVSGSASSRNFTLPGLMLPPGTQPVEFEVEVTPGFLETLHIPLLAGRSILATDTPASQPVAVVNEAFVKRYSANQNPLGRRFSLGGKFVERGVEIVGVVPDSRYFDVREEPKPMIFFSAWQGKGYTPYVGDIVIRTSRPPETVMPEVRRVLASVDRRLPILDEWTLIEQINHSFQREHMITQLCGVFSLLALLLAAVGIYGSSTYVVSRRTPEMGVRMALGAQRSDILWMIFGQAFGLILAGLAVGVPLAVWAMRLLKSFLFGVAPVDAASLIAAVALLSCGGVLAGYLPARRATRIDPLRALRWE